MHIFRHLFSCFQTSGYTSEEFRQNKNNSAVFEEFSVSNCGFDGRKYPFYWLQLFKYSTVNP